MRPVADRVLEAWLRAQWQAARDLVARSDLLRVVPVGIEPYRTYDVHLATHGLVWPPEQAGPAVHRRGFRVWIAFGEEYLRLPARGVFVLRAPRHVFHPNIVPHESGEPQAICVGRIRPGTSLTTLIRGIHRILSWQGYTLDDALNGAACAYARGPARGRELPVDPRPIVRRQPRVRLLGSAES